MSISLVIIITGTLFFLSELPGESRDYLRQEMKKLVDDGKLERLYNGVYYLSYTTILETKGRISIDRYIDKKYLNINGEASGYITGLQLAPLRILHVLKSVVMKLPQSSGSRSLIVIQSLFINPLKEYRHRTSLLYSFWILCP